MIMQSICRASAALLITLSLCSQPVLASGVTLTPSSASIASLQEPLQDPAAKLESEAKELTKKELQKALKDAHAAYETNIEDQKVAEPEQLDGLKETQATLARKLRIYSDILESQFQVTGGDLDKARELLLLHEGKLSDLNAAAALGLAEQATKASYDWLVKEGPGIAFGILKFILILFIFRILAGILSRIVSKATKSSKLQISSLLRDFAISSTRRLTTLIGLLVAINSAGINIAPLVAGITALGLVIGLALQGTLSNFASGIMLLLYRPFDVGDLVTACSVTGKVDSMNLVSTTILTLDNQVVIVPNNSIWSNVITNITANDTRRVDLVFGIGYSDDIQKAEAVIREILSNHAMVMKEPEPIVKLYNLNESSVDFVCRPWCKTEDYWDVHWDVTRTVKLRFDEEGISIPFPQRDVHMFSQPEAAQASITIAPPKGGKPKPTPRTGAGEVDAD